MNDPQSYADIIAGLRGNDKDKEKALLILSERLIYVDPSLVDGLPLQEWRNLCSSLVSILEEPTTPIKILILALQCINSILPINFGASLYFIRILRRINEILYQTNSPEAGANCFRIISFFSQQLPAIIPNAIDIRCFIKFMPILSRVDQRECISLLANITPHLPSNEMIALFPFLIQYIQDEDEFIRKKALSIFSTVIGSLPNIQLPERAIENLSDQLDSANNFDTFSTLVQILRYVSQTPENVVYVSKYLPDLTTLLFTYDDAKSESNILDILISIIPTPSLPKELWSYPLNKTTNKYEVANTILPVIIIYICEKQKNVFTSIKILAACASILSNFSCDQALLNILLHRVYSQKYAPYIVEIALSIQSKEDVIRSGLLKNLLSVKTHRSISLWFHQKLNKLKEECKPFARSIPLSISKSKNLSEIVQYIEKEKIFPFEFCEYKLIDKVTTLFKQNPIELSPYLEELGVRCLDFIQFPKASIKSDTHLFSKMVVKFSTYGPKGPLSECQLPIHSDFLMIEGWYNLKYNAGCVERLRQAIEDNYLLQLMIEIDEDLTKSHMRFAILSRTFQVDGYYKCSFRVGTHVFSAYDNLTYMLSKCCTNPSIISQTRFDLSIIHNEVSRSSFEVPPMNDPSIQKVILYMKTIQTKMRNEQFANHVFSKLDNPLLTLTLMSPSVQMMYSAPFLFSFEQRRFLFKTVAFDTVYGLRNIHDNFPAEADKKCKPQLSVIKCSINRDLTFEYGCFVLSRIGCGRLRTEFAFKEDLGFGPGVTQEFFAIMSREFCKRKTKMWRDNDVLNPESELVQFEGGLFPSADADDGLLKILGILCSKAVIMEKLVDIPFRSAFFKLILQGEISIDEVDPILGQSLRCPEGLYDLPFVYPGTNLELKKGGTSIYVDEGNVKEYVRLVTDFTCGQRMLKKLSHFIKTFEMNLQLKALSIFTPDEIVSVICGNEVHFSKKELFQYTKIEHGYNDQSPEINNLFDVIEEMSPEEQRMFCKFVTGCSRLPNGGLSGLKPPLTIAKRVPELSSNHERVHPDDFLPSVMTCTNYFKLPSYSTKEIMKSKIMTAIYECQDSFLLS